MGVPRGATAIWLCICIVYAVLVGLHIYNTV